MARKWLKLHTPKSRREIWVDVSKIESVIQVALPVPEQTYSIPTARDLLDGNYPAEEALPVYGSQLRMDSGDYGVVLEPVQDVMRRIQDLGNRGDIA